MNEPNEPSCEKCEWCSETGTCPKMAMPNESAVNVWDQRIRLPLICRFYTPKPEPSACEKAYEEAKLVHETTDPLPAFHSGFHRGIAHGRAEAIEDAKRIVRDYCFKAGTTTNIIAALDALKESEA